MGIAMASIARQAIFAVDHSKFITTEGTGMLALGGFDPKPVIVTDRDLPDTMLPVSEMAEIIVAK